MQNTLWNTGLDESQAEIKIARWNINLRYVDDTILLTESEEEQNNFLMRAKEESEKASLKLNIKKTKIMTSDLILMTNRRAESERRGIFYFHGLQNHWG